MSETIGILTETMVIPRSQTPERQEYMKGWYEDHKQDRAAYMKNYYEKHKQKFIDKADDWRRNNIDKARQSARERMRRVRHTPEGRDYQRKIDSLMREKYPEKVSARKAVFYALKTGKLVKAEACEMCGQKLFLHAHHSDYSKKLDVKWLCTKCHNIADAEVK